VTAHVPQPTVTMRQALSDDLLGSVMVGESWRPWKILLIALMREALDDAEREIFRRFTGREREPLERCKEGLFIVGRRGGKSFATAVLIVYLATMIDYRGVLNVGERPRALCLAQNTDQARIVFDYVCGIFAAVSILAKLVRSRLNEALELSNGLTVEVRAASFRGLRGLTCVAIVADEVAWWFTDTDSVNSDVEILNSVRPSLITTRGLLAVISTVYARRGAVFETWSKHYGPSGNPRILVARGSTQDFNSECPQEEIDDAMARDAVVARSEYFSEWRVDVEGFITKESVLACVTLGCREIAPMPVEYVAFCDPAGGSGGGDSMTIAIAHREGDVAVLDALRVRPPRFSPDDVVTEFAELLRRYKITEVVSDRWGSGFVAEAFEKRGITHRTSERVKSEIYREALALINSRKVELLNDERLINELCSLERRVARGGKDSVDHAVGRHDDIANACCGALVLGSGVGGDEFSVREFVAAWGNASTLAEYDRERATRLN
jgi:hypothetical protein